MNLNFTNFKLKQLYNSHLKTPINRKTTTSFRLFQNQQFCFTKNDFVCKIKT